MKNKLKVFVFLLVLSLGFVSAKVNINQELRLDFPSTKKMILGTETPLADTKTKILDPLHDQVLGQNTYKTLVQAPENTSYCILTFMFCNSEKRCEYYQGQDYVNMTTDDGKIYHHTLRNLTQTNSTTFFRESVNCYFNEGYDNDWVDFTVNLSEDENSAPVITSTPNLSAIINELYMYQLSATDAQGDEVTFLLNESPSGMSIDSSALLTWKPETSGEYHVKIFASDGKNLSEPQAFTIKVTAQNEQLSLNSVLLGGPDAQKSTDQEQRYASAVLFVTNTGASTQFATLSTTAASKYNVTFSKNNLAIDAGQTEQVTVTGLLPKDLDAVNSDLKQAPVIIGEIRAEFSGQSATSILQMEAENHLKFEKVYVYVNGDRERLSDGEEIDGIPPGAKIEIEVFAENTFSDADDFDVTIEDVEVELEEDDDLDVDESKEIGDIDAEDEDEIRLAFDIDYDIDDDQYTLFIRLFGEDEYGAHHGESWSVDLEVEKENHDLSIRTLQVTPMQPVCGENVMIQAYIDNIGKNDEDEARFGMSLRELDFEDQREFSISEGDSERFSFDLYIPDDTDERTYTLRAYAYYDYDNQVDSETITFNVVCPEDVKETTVPTQTPKNKQETAGGKEDVDTGISEDDDFIPGRGAESQDLTVEERAFESFRDSSTYVMLLVILSVVILGGVIFFIGSLIYN